MTRRMVRHPVRGAALSGIFEAVWYGEFPSFLDDPLLPKWNLWGHIDRARRVLGFEPGHSRRDHIKG